MKSIRISQMPRHASAAQPLSRSHPQPPNGAIVHTAQQCRRLHPQPHASAASRQQPSSSQCLLSCPSAAAPQRISCRAVSMQKQPQHGCSPGKNRTAPRGCLYYFFFFFLGGGFWAQLPSALFTGAVTLCSLHGRSYPLLFFFSIKSWQKTNFCTC